MKKIMQKIINLDLDLFLINIINIKKIILKKFKILFKALKLMKNNF